jgi:tetratricopeptide (TPR) repeat protein
LRPGLPWQESLEKEIERIKSAAVFVGKNSIGPWQQQELNAFLREFVNRGCPVIPVLLPDAPKEPKLPLFLKGMTWIDFRKNERDSIERLIWGITGERDWMERTKKIESESTSVNQIFDIPKIKTQEEDHREKMKAKSESLNKGLALNRLGEYQEAITAFDTALEIDPDKIAWDNKEFDKIAWSNKGLALDNLGEYQEAITAFDKALKIDPKHKQALYNKGLTLNRLGKYQEAMAVYDKALEIDPNKIAGYYKEFDKKVWTNKGVALDNLGKYKEAITAFDNALKIDPQYKLALDNKEIAIKKLHPVGYA